LRGYDYARPDAYFITIVTLGRSLVFLNQSHKQVAEDSWRWLVERHNFLDLDEFVVMPNHLHGILVINHRATKPLGRLVGAFKTVSTKLINELRSSPGQPVWQQDYYESIIRTERHLENVRRYIADNPLNWAFDPMNAERMQ
jgi:REP element-mobilizing transposase RayT